jgi:hypothetical protein
MRSFALATILALFSLIFASPSSATSPVSADELGFTMSALPLSNPAITANGYFVYRVQGSTGLTGSVLLKNPGTLAITIELAAVDATTAQTGGTAFETGDVTTNATGAWLKLATSSVTLAGGTQQPVDFVVTVPQSAGPGQYLAGISAYVRSVPSTAVADQGSARVGASVTMQTRYVIGVQVDVAGTWQPSLKIDSVFLVQQPSGPFIGIHMENGGDTLFKSSGTFVLADASGKRVLDQPIELGTFVPGTAIIYPVRWSGNLAPGTYQAEVVVDYGANKQAIYRSGLEIGAEKDEQNSAVAPPQPGTIGGPGNSGNAVDSVNPQAAATSQAQERRDVWAWPVVGLGVLAIACALLLEKRRKAQADGKAL